MESGYTRRQFCFQSLCYALLPGGIRLISLPTRDSNGLQVVQFGEFDWLSVAMDEIIPQGDGMPSASAVGGVQYLQLLSWQYPPIREELRNFALKLSHTSLSIFKTEFTAVQASGRLQVLKQLEKDDHKTFAGFVSYVYEAYYTRPQVLGLIACSTPRFPLNDLEALLAGVKKRKALYRKAP